MRRCFELDHLRRDGNFIASSTLHGDTIHHCGDGALDPFLKRGIDWLGSHFDVRQNLGHGQQYKFYYLYGLERVGRLAAVRFLGKYDWYREGALEIVRQQNKISGFWNGPGESQLVATSFALLFLAKGRAPVLVNKLRDIYPAPTGITMPTTSVIWSVSSHVIGRAC